MYYLIKDEKKQKFLVRNKKSLKNNPHHKKIIQLDCKRILKNLRYNLNKDLPKIYLERVVPAQPEWDEFCKVKYAVPVHSQNSTNDNESKEKELFYIPESTYSESEDSGETAKLFKNPYLSPKVPLTQHASVQNQVKRRLFTVTDNVTDSSSKTNYESKHYSHISHNLNVENSELRKKKGHCCFYCKKVVVNFVRHLEQIHKNEDEVKNFLLYPKGNHQRKKMIEILRKKGDHIHNTDKIYNTGKLIVSRRPKQEKNRDMKHFVPCANCKGFYSKLSLRKHYKECCKPAATRPFSKSTPALGRAVQRRIHYVACDKLRTEVFPFLRQDRITAAIQFDKLAVMYGNEQCEKYRSPHLHKMIRARLRLVGLFLLNIKELDKEISNLEDVFQPKYYKLIIEAIHKMGKLKDDGKYKSPATAADARAMIIRCAQILDREYLVVRNKEKREIVQDFLVLFKSTFSTAVTNIVKETKLENQRRKIIKLPSIEDIKIINNYLKEKRRYYFKKLKENFSYTDWEKLAAFTLISLQIFNRRRPGEIERMLIEDYKTYQNVEEDDLFISLSEKEQQLAKLYGRCSLRGKLGRPVSLVISNEIKICIDLLQECRSRTEIDSRNPYLFAIKSDDRRFRHAQACELMRKFSLACHVKCPKSLRATKLRKHIATHSVTLDLAENDTNSLADFMGHSKKIHDDIYCLPIAARDCTKITNFLLHAQGENETTVQKKSLVSAAGDFNDNSVRATPENEQTSFDTQPTDIEKTIGSTPRDYMELASASSRNCVPPAETLESDKSTEEDDTGTKVWKISRETWTTPEKAIMRKEFSKNFESKTLPSLEYCMKIKESNQQLHSRKVETIKAWVNNQIKRTERLKKVSAKKATWTTPERQAMRKAFDHHLKEMTLPTTADCEEAILDEPALASRNAVTAKAWVYNEINRIKKRLNM